ncbi:MAG: hypothetical protein NTX24_02330 [Candidatus Pacearchaeota archaeon]|nr:hypothetical protein [Candidatus Pacearchaeota archaeon]
MRPRTMLLITGFLTTVISLAALFRNSISPSIMGAAIADKIQSLPSSPALYFAMLLALGVFSIIIAFMERKIVY